MASIIAALVLLLLSGLALTGGVKPTAADTISLLFLGVLALVCRITPLRKRLIGNRDAATFALLAAAVVLYQLADRAGPQAGQSLRLALLPDDAFVVSYATRLAVLGGLLSLPAWWNIKESGPEKYLLLSLGLVGALALGSFWYLGRFYPVGPTEVVDPTPIATLLLQLVGYCGLALTCRAATENEKVRHWIFTLLPVILLAVWARHTFWAAPEEVETDE